ncbi:ABC transporter ATP-binding protein [Amphibacillus indicireducens]|uniref:ABC transporter ATP-binding protein n=1 Tax=Amphibacillus indicireducens TaxID=1076330 RepID=A0ABP7VH35_9BACI
MLKTRKYKWIDILRIPFEISPLLLVAFVLLELTQALISTFAIVFATSFFVDTAFAVIADELIVSTVYAPLGALLGVVAISNIFDHLLGLLQSRLKIVIEFKLEPTILDTRASLKYKYIEDSDTCELVERLSEGIVENMLNGVRAFTTVARSIVSIAAILSLILTQVWWATILIAILSIPLLWMSLKAGGKNYNAWMEAWPYERRFSYYSDDILTSREATQERTLFGYADYIVNLHGEHFEIARKIQEKVAIRTKMAMEATGIFMSVIALLISFTLIKPVIAGTLNPGMFMGIVAAVFTMATSIGGTLQEAAKNLSYAKRCMDDLTAFMALDLQEGATDLPDKIPPVFERLSFKNVWFKYPNAENYALRNVSFDIEVGNHFAFVGANGSGKTTIIKLLTGLYDVYDGEILINGKELRTYEASTLKAMFSVVYQDFSRYEISLADNIALGNTSENVSIEDIHKVTDKVALTDTITNLKDGLRTPLGKIDKDGSDLSGGQWQKVAIARSLISPAPIKILDEPTAALDPIAESRIYQEFEELMRGKTTIFISHRLGSTKLANEILVIESGEITERGTHNKLIKMRGVYAKMFELQRRWYE